LATAHKLQLPEILSRCNELVKSSYQLKTPKEILDISRNMTLASVSPKNFMLPFTAHRHLAIVRLMQAEEREQREQQEEQEEQEE
jgi:hypothetical protein